MTGGRPTSGLPVRSVALTLLLLLLTACVPAAQSELPREVRGPQVHAERQKAISVADDALSRATGSAPVQAGLDGCLDLRAERSGYTWRCSVLRSTTLTGTDVEETLAVQHERLRGLGCTAYPGLATTARRYEAGITPAYLYDVDYRCDDQVVVVIRFSEPDDPSLAAKTDLGTVIHGPGRGNVISEQTFAPDVVRSLKADSTKRLIMVVTVQKSYWMLPRGA